MIYSRFFNSFENTYNYIDLNKANPKKLSFLPLVVEGVNVVKKHVRPSQMNPDGGIVEFEAPIHASNVMIVDPKSGKPTRVGYKFVDGKKVRFAKKSGEVL